MHGLRVTAQGSRYPVAGLTALVAVITADTIAAFALWFLRDEEPVVLGTAWPALFAVGALAGACLLARPRWVHAYCVSGSVTALAVASRVLGVIARYQSGQLPGWRAVLGVDLYLLVAVLVFAAWVAAVEPWRAQSVADREGR